MLEERSLHPWEITRMTGNTALEQITEGLTVPYMVMPEAHLQNYFPKNVSPGKAPWKISCSPFMHLPCIKSVSLLPHKEK